MSYHVLVRHGFGEYTAGSLITDQSEVADLIENHSNQVVRFWVDDAAPTAEEPVAETVFETVPEPTPEVVVETPQAEPVATEQEAAPTQETHSNEAPE